MWPTYNFDLLKLAIVGVTARAIVAVFVAIGTLILLTRYLYHLGHDRWLNK